MTSFIGQQINRGEFDYADEHTCINFIIKYKLNTRKKIGVQRTAFLSAIYTGIISENI